MYLQFRLGADGMGPGQLGALGKAALNGVPVIVFFATMNFPAVSTYINNFLPMSIICMAK